MERGRSAGIDLFLEDGAYTTLTSAVSILVILSLLFAIASGIWSMSRAGDTQVAADVTALAGANVVSSYHTAATVLDASVLSMGLAGLCVTGAGLVGLLIPGVNAVAPQTINAGLRMLEARNKLAASASKGLKALESSLPFVIAANGTRACAAQGSDEVVFTGTALAVPLSSGSDFPALEGEQVSTEGIENAAGELDEAAQELAAAAEGEGKRGGLACRLRQRRAEHARACRETLVAFRHGKPRLCLEHHLGARGRAQSNAFILRMASRARRTGERKR